MFDCKRVIGASGELQEATGRGAEPTRCDAKA